MAPDLEPAKGVFLDLVTEMIQAGMTPLMLRTYLEEIIESTGARLNVPQMATLGKLLFPDAEWERNKTGTRVRAYIGDVVRFDILCAHKVEAFELYEGKWLCAFSCKFYGKGTIERVWRNMQYAPRTEFPTGERVTHHRTYGDYTEVVKAKKKGFGYALYAMWLVRHNEWRAAKGLEPRILGPEEPDYGGYVPDDEDGPALTDEELDAIADTEAEALGS